MVKSLLLVSIALLFAPGGDDPYRNEIDRWRAERVERLRREDGWLTLVGLFWLEPGDNSIGSDPRNRVVLPPGKAPRRMGSLTLSHGTVTAKLDPAAGVTTVGKPVSTLTLAPDTAPNGPTVLKRGPLSFYLISRGDRLGVRVKDAQSAARREFHGIEAFPVDPRWRALARFEPYPKGKPISVPTILGTVENETSPGALVFEIDGREFRLDPVLESGETDFFVIFGDQTNGKETYGGGRFLYASPPDPEGRTVLDFNKAYNPPCVFSPFATCPLPPAQNKLPLRVEAGEKNYEH